MLVTIVVGQWMWLAKPDTPKSWLVQGFLSAVGTHQCFCLKVFEFFTAEGKLQRERQRRGGNNKRVTAKEGRREKLVPFLLAPCPHLQATHTSVSYIWTRSRG